VPYRLQRSILGQGVTVHGPGGPRRRRPLQLVLGDHSQARL